MGAHLAITLVETKSESVNSWKPETVIQGRAKKFLASDRPDVLIQTFMLNGADDNKRRLARSTIPSLRNDISSYLFEYLEGYRVPTHYIRKISGTEMMVKRLDMIPLLVTLYNVAGGPLAQRFGLQEGKSLDFPVIEHYYRDGKGNTEWLNEHHLYAFNILPPDDLRQINRLVTKVNAVIRGLCDRRQLLLASIRLEFGRHKGQIAIADELSPHTCHFLDLGTQNAEARDRFHPDHSNAEETFAELRDRLQLKL